MIKFATTLLCLTLVGCGSFPLGTSYPQKGQTQAETDAAILFCKDRAKDEASTPGRVAASFVAGATIVGAPVAIAEDHRKQREVFATCMHERDFYVVPPA